MHLIPNEIVNPGIFPLLLIHKALVTETSKCYLLYESTETSMTATSDLSYCYSLPEFFEKSHTLLVP
jgi:hypothetical protein